MKQLILFLLAGAVFPLSGQTILHIQEASGEPVPGAKLEAGAVGDSVRILRRIAGIDGTVDLGTVEGMYSIKISYPGFDTFSDTLLLQGRVSVFLHPVLEVEEMVVTAQSQATSIENAVQKITVISAEQIARSGSNNLADILTYQTGIRLSQDNVLGSSMDLGGISGQNVKILVDGVPVIGRQNGNIDLTQINLANVERIEVVEGPLSVNYGTNALAGTVNIITKKERKDVCSAELNPYYETIGNYNLSGVLAVDRSRHHWNLEGLRNFFDGWTDGDAFIEFPKKRPADTNRVKTWKPREQYSVGTRYSYIRDTWQLSLFGKYFHELIVNRGMPSAPYYETAFDDYYRTQRLDAGLSGEAKLGKGHLNFLCAYNDYQRRKNTYFKDLTTLNQVLSETAGAQDTSRFSQWTARLIYNGRIGKKITYQVGTDINYTNGWGRRIEGGHRDIGDYAGFVTLDWKLLDSLTIKPGVRYACNSAYNSPVIPSLNILYRVRKFSFRAAVARGFRAPDLKELYMDFVDINHNITGNRELKAENSWNYSFFANWMKPLKKNALVKIEYSAYYNDIDNLITLGIVDNSSYTYINIGTYSTIGQQLGVNYRSKRAQVQVSATYIGRYNPDSETEAGVKRYSFSPETSARIAYYLIEDRLQANVFYKFNGKLQSFYVNEDSEVITSVQSAYHILDAGITALFLKDRRLSVTLGAKNLLNVKQVNVIGQNQGGVHSGSSDFNAGRGVSAFLSLHYRITLMKGRNEK